MNYRINYTVNDKNYDAQLEKLSETLSMLLEQRYKLSKPEHIEKIDHWIAIVEDEFDCLVNEIENVGA